MKEFVQNCCKIKEDKNVEKKEDFEENKNIRKLPKINLLCIYCQAYILYGLTQARFVCISQQISYYSNTNGYSTLHSSFHSGVFLT